MTTLPIPLPDTKQTRDLVRRILETSRGTTFTCRTARQLFIKRYNLSITTTLCALVLEEMAHYQLAALDGHSPYGDPQYFILP